MSRRFRFYPAVAFILGLAACNQTTETKVKITMQGDFPAPPVAAVKPEMFNEFGNQRTDNYFWLKEKTNPEVIAYLNAENAYCDTVMKSTVQLQDKLFAEMKGRIKETDETVPQLDNGYYYYSRTEEGMQYRIYCRKKGNVSAPEEVIFNANKLAEGKKAFLFGGYDVSTDNKLAAYVSNETGSFADFTLKIKDLVAGVDLPLSIEKVQGFAWANDGKTIFYTIGNDALRAYRVYRHTIGSTNPDELVFEEPDEQFILNVEKSKTDDFVFITSGSFSTTEYLYLPAGEPTGKFRVFIPRVKDVEYHVFHHKEKFFIKYKDRENLNSMVYEAPLKGYENRSNWKVVIPHDKNARIEGLEVFQDYLVAEIRKNGLTEINILGLKDGKQKTISFPEPVYTAYLQGTPEYTSTSLRYGYSSLNRPSSVFEYDMISTKSTLLKQQEIPGGFNPEDYTVERVWATAGDGVKVPMSVVYKKSLKKDGSNPALLYSYGSYGYSSDAYFISSFYSLIDRGFVFAIAQIRGGSDMGEQWYEDGKLLKKKNTFTDFISCGEQLISDKYTSSDKLAIMGGSAGGLLVGAVVNMRPELFHTVVAQVPFVDVINTMLDTSLPLTTQEYEEWGNPNVEEYYRYMLSYSPYDNVKAQNYPNMLVTGGLNDSQVGYQEPAKFVAKLRALKTDNNILLLKTNMESGHGGATGRFDALRETAFEVAFILNRVGVVE
ncbi:MAG: S9 family peptidase [Bacteroidales bacterium]|nr:S9 family peptidase [Bacteroidales bacterium]